MGERSMASENQTKENRVFSYLLVYLDGAGKPKAGFALTMKNKT